MLRGIGYTAHDVDTMSPARVRYYREFYSDEAKEQRRALYAANRADFEERIWGNLNAPNPTYARLVEQQRLPQAARDLNLENLNAAAHQLQLETATRMAYLQQQQLRNPRPGQAFNVQDVWTVRHLR